MCRGRRRPARVSSVFGAIDCAGVLHRIAGQRQQIHAVTVQRPLRVEASQQQQVLHQSPIRRDSSSMRDINLAISRASTLAVQLGEAADRRQRRAQFVAGVGDEAAHPLLGLRACSADDSEDATARWICAACR